MTLSFRFATSADIPALVALVDLAYRGDIDQVGWTTEAQLLEGQRTDADEMRDCIEKPRSLVLIAEQNGDLVGTANVAVEDDGAAWFGMFAVRPGLQRGGLGKQLLAEAERIARDEWKSASMRMSVIDVRDELIAFYERRGYTRTGIKKPFPYGDTRFGQPRREDLRFEVLEKRL